MKKQPCAMIAVALSPLLMVSCIGLEYPSYWATDDAFLVNLITLPFEVLITPIIFVLKIFPVL